MRSAHPTHGGKTYGVKGAAHSQPVASRTYWVAATGERRADKKIQQLANIRKATRAWELMGKPFMRAQRDLSAVAAVSRGGSHVSADSQESLGTRRCFNAIVCDRGARGGMSLLSQRVGMRGWGGGLHKLTLMRLPIITPPATGREYWKDWSTWR